MVNAHLNRSRLRDMRSGRKHSMVTYKQGLGIYKEVRRYRTKESIRQGGNGVTGVDEINETLCTEGSGLSPGGD